MLADCDVGNVIAAAQAGTRTGYRLLPLLVLLIPMLIVVQRLAARLGAGTGLGFGALVRARFGRRWAVTALAGLVVATLGSLITEFAGIAGVGEMYGVSRSLTLPLAAVALVALLRAGTRRGAAVVALTTGLCELAFFYVAWAAHPQLTAMLRAGGDQHLSRNAELYLGAALIGATFSPWMIFYQQAASAADDAPDPWLWDTEIGAVLTQAVTAAVLIAAAATLGARGGDSPLDSVGAISRALTPFLGGAAGRAVFGVGVVGAATVAALVCAQALARGLAEVAGAEPRTALLSTALVAGSAMVAWQAPDLVWLGVGAQAVNALLLPLTMGLLVALAATALPARMRLRGPALWGAASVAGLASLAGWIGAVAGML